MDESFSVRYGFEERRNALQVDSMDDALRNGLWNCVDAYLRSNARRAYTGVLYPPVFATTLWDEFLKARVDQMPKYSLSDFMSSLANWFMKAPWNKVYDLLEYLAASAGTEGFISSCNAVLARESSGYRFIKSRIVPIVSLPEVEEVQKALITAPMPVKKHLDSALTLLSDREAPNYRKSVDESISAVEAAVKALTGNSKGTLPDGLKALREELHPSQIQGFIKLYGYTSDEGGIRHALTADSREVDGADARYMLVACSAFINYLRSKASRELP